MESTLEMIASSADWSQVVARAATASKAINFQALMAAKPILLRQLPKQKWDIRHVNTFCNVVLSYAILH